LKAVLSAKKWSDKFMAIFNSSKIGAGNAVRMNYAGSQAWVLPGTVVGVSESILVIERRMLGRREIITVHADEIALLSSFLWAGSDGVWRDHSNDPVTSSNDGFSMIKDEQTITLTTGDVANVCCLFMECSEQTDIVSVSINVSTLEGLKSWEWVNIYSHPKFQRFTEHTIIPIVTQDPSSFQVYTGFARLDASGINLFFDGSLGDDWEMSGGITMILTTEV